MSLYAGARLGLFTAASMVAAVDSAVGGTGIALAVYSGTHATSAWPSIVAGIIGFAAFFGVFFIYQTRRCRRLAHLAA